jgi:hypothetical protein
MASHTIYTYALKDSNNNYFYVGATKLDTYYYQALVPPTPKPKSKPFLITKK